MTQSTNLSPSISSWLQYVGQYLVLRTRLNQFGELVCIQSITMDGLLWYTNGGGELGRVRLNDILSLR